MKKLFLTIALTALTLSGLAQDQLPTRAEVLKLAQKVNSWFMKKYDPADAFLGGGKVRTTNLWTRAVYHEGLCALYSIYPLEEYYEYNLKMAEGNKWSPRYGAYSLDADNYACVQTYVDLYRLEPESYKLRKAIACFDAIVNNPDNSGWWWIDAIQMGMPAFAKLGRTTGNYKYWDKMWQMYEYTRNQYDGGLWNAAEGLWWRDHDFNPPYTTPNGKNCYWSRGNGWVYAALVRSMNELPEKSKEYKELKKDFLLMSKALLECQHDDGFWHASLVSDAEYPGPEMTGTALFLYGMSWGILHGLLKDAQYHPACDKAWQALKSCLHKDGFLGWNQGTGKEPSAGQPVTFTSVPDFEDYGTGCYLLGLSEYYKLQTR